MAVEDTVAEKKLPLGIIVIVTFKWLFLLLLAVLAEKLIDGIDSRAFAPTLGEFWPWNQNSGPLLLNFLTAIALSAVILAYAVRYLLCSVDAIERVVCIGEDYHSWAEIRPKLENIKVQMIAFTLIVAIAEIFPILESAKSLNSSVRAVTWLIGLVVVDCFLFFVVLTFIAYRLQRRAEKKAHQELAATSEGVCSERGVQEFTVVEADARALCNSMPDYFLWNAFDLGILALYLHCLNGIDVKGLCSFFMVFGILLVLFEGLHRYWRQGLQAPNGGPRALSFKDWCTQVGWMCVAFVPLLGVAVWNLARGPVDPIWLEFWVGSGLLIGVGGLVGANFWFQRKLWMRHLAVLFYARGD